MDKKSERLEVRLSHSDKESFQSACESSGETPSDVIRRFIRRYIRRADSDRVGEGLVALQAMAGRNGLKLAAAGLAVCVGLVAAFDLWPRGEAVADENKQAWPPYERELFAKYDSNGDGQLRPGDIRADDAPLFRVLDLDASGTIDVHEFISDAKMTYALSSSAENRDLSPNEVADACFDNMETLAFNLVTFNLSSPGYTLLVDAPVAGDPGPNGELRFSGFDRMVVWRDSFADVCMVAINDGFAQRPKPQN